MLAALESSHPTWVDISVRAPNQPGPRLSPSGRAAGPPANKPKPLTRSFLPRAAPLSPSQEQASTEDLIRIDPGNLAELYTSAFYKCVLPVVFFSHSLLENTPKVLALNLRHRPTIAFRRSAWTMLTGNGAVCITAEERMFVSIVILIGGFVQAIVVGNIVR